ncbi:MAG: PQQ-binding-like beta-propeller repeat protein, partial [Planctomycetaceae bacterium]
MKCFLLAITSAAVLLTTVNAQAENWPQWRGPSFNGVSGETNLPTEFGPDQNVAWKLPLPGPAGATPVIWEDRIFLTSVDGENLVLLCASTDGKELW